MNPYGNPFEPHRETLAKVSRILMSLTMSAGDRVANAMAAIQDGFRETPAVGDIIGPYLRLNEMLGDGDVRARAATLSTDALDELADVFLELDRVVTASYFEAEQRGDAQRLTP